MPIKFWMALSGPLTPVEHAENRPVRRVADHRRRARPFLHVLAKVLGRMHLNGLPQHEGSTDGVRSHRRLEPVVAGDEAGMLNRVAQPGVAFDIENGALGVGEDHHRAGMGKKPACLHQEGAAGRQKALVAVAQRLEFAAFERPGHLTGRAHVSCGAATPRVVDRASQGRDRCRQVAAQELLPCGLDPRVVLRTRQRTRKDPLSHVSPGAGAQCSLENRRGSKFKERGPSPEVIPDDCWAKGERAHREGSARVLATAERRYRCR